MWTNKWPTKPGWYWFYGRFYGEDRHSLGIVRVIQVSNGLTYILDGHGMFKSEGHDGVFHPLIVPTIPAEIAGGNFSFFGEKNVDL